MKTINVSDETYAKLEAFAAADAESQAIDAERKEALAVLADIVATLEGAEAKKAEVAVKILKTRDEAAVAVARDFLTPPVA